MTRPGKIPAQVGNKPRVCRSRGGRLNHWAKEAGFVWGLAGDDDYENGGEDEEGGEDINCNHGARVG